MPDEQEEYEPSHPRGTWATRRDLAKRIAAKLGTDSRLPASLRGQAGSSEMEDVMTEAIEAFGLSYEFKILRLTEKVKDAIKSGAFGPLQIPNSVDVEGMKILTPVGEIYSLFKDIYTPEFLDMFDEEGELLPEAEE